MTDEQIDAMILECNLGEVKAKNAILKRIRNLGDQVCVLQAKLVEVEAQAAAYLVGLRAVSACAEGFKGHEDCEAICGEAHGVLNRAMHPPTANALLTELEALRKLETAARAILLIVSDGTLLIECTPRLAREMLAALSEVERVRMEAR